MNVSYTAEKVELQGILAEFREALTEEINKIKQSGQSSTLLYAGRKIKTCGMEHWYQFGVEYAPALPADTPCKLLIGREQFGVTVVGFEENAIILSTQTPLPDTIGKARLENGATVLMERLIKCIEENAKKENPTGKRMLPSEGDTYSARCIFTYDDLEPRDGNTESQNQAILSALSNDITYIWGPPGTGKTTVIGQIIDELYKHDRSVLVVSHTNAAVDGAIKKADAFFPAHTTDYPILRIGIPTRPLPERVLLKHHVDVLGRELYEQKEVLEKQKDELEERIKELLLLLGKALWVKENNLEQISEMLQVIAGYTERISAIRSEMEDLRATMRQEKAANPEYANVSILSQMVKEKEADHDAVCARVQKYEVAIHDLPLQIQQAKDEIKKHDVYAELREREAKYMSASFLQNELEKISEQITVLRNKISRLTEEQASAQTILTTYEKKNSVAKFFASKSTVIQAQAKVRDIQARLPLANEELIRKCNLEEEYKHQLESLLLLQEQINAVVPSKTQEYWINELDRLQAALVSAKEDLPELQAHRSLVYEELCTLEQKKDLAKKSFDKLNECEERVRQKQKQLEKIKTDYSQETNLCSEYLARECSYCAAFQDVPEERENATLFHALSRALTSVKAEVASVQVEAVRDEKEQAEIRSQEVFRRLHEVNEKILQIEKQAIMNAKIVGATLAKSYLSENLRERTFDTVILDEASMASIPALWCASCLAESSIVIVGDFLQLPPIVMAETPMAKKWLGKDIFYHSGMQERAKDKGSCPDNFVMLNDQFRMESDIADVANMYYGEYGGLRSHDVSEGRIRERTEFYQWYPGKKTRSNIHLIDTESLHAWVTGVPQGRGHSRLNCFSAAVDVDLAFKLLENKLNALDPETVEDAEKASVLIVAPYKPHVARINQLVELEYRNRGFPKNLGYIRAGTIHSFQGSEADIVIFDLVIDEPHWKANLFMTDRDTNENLRKMFNVAVTRAKFKLYIVGNFSYCQKRAKNNALSELLDKLIRADHLVKTDAKEILPDLSFSRQTECTLDQKLASKHIICREESFHDYFLADIKAVKKRLIVYSPFITEARLSVLLPSFVDAINAGKQIIIVTKALSDRGKTELTQYKKCENELRAIGVSILHKRGMHEKLIFIDSDAIWIGSLNALSFTGLTGEVMQRHADQELTREYEKLFDIEHLCGAIENTHEQQCPICGGEMLVKESDAGGIYWQCVEGDYSRNAAQQYPTDGILRCKCGAPYIFSMKNQPRWVCSENPRHFQKMRESDLKLDKMAALIPTKTERKEVDLYFAQKFKERGVTKRGKSKSQPIKVNASKKNTDASYGEEQLKLF